jgi:CheY-like chemotaxis protein
VAHGSVFVVDDEDLVRWSLGERLEQEGCEVLGAGTLAEARARCEEGVDLVPLDLRLPDGDGLDFLADLRRGDPDLPVVLMTAFSSVKGAVAAMKGGAFHYVSKPFDLDEVALVVQQALEATRLRRELRHLRSRHGGSSIDALVGESAAMMAVKDTLRKIATSPASTVLLTGESGTGKDLHLGRRRPERGQAHAERDRPPEAPHRPGQLAPESRRGVPSLLGPDLRHQQGQDVPVPPAPFDLPPGPLPSLLEGDAGWLPPGSRPPRQLPALEAFRVAGIPSSWRHSCILGLLRRADFVGRCTQSDQPRSTGPACRQPAGGGAHDFGPARENAPKGTTMKITR